MHGIRNILAPRNFRDKIVGYSKGDFSFKCQLYNKVSIKEFSVEAILLYSFLVAYNLHLEGPSMGVGLAPSL